MSHAKEIAIEIFSAGVDAVRPGRVIPEDVRREGEMLVIGGRRYKLPEKGRIVVLGSGKAAIPMANALSSVVGDLVSGGVVVSSYEDTLWQKLALKTGCHPYPCRRSIEAADMLIGELAALTPEDFFIYLLSGGSSALIEKPIPPVTLEDLRETTALLLQHAIPIERINCVRKHLSLIKGGKLAQMTKAPGVVLVISDVVGDDLEAIGSAPLFRDNTTREEAVTILKEANIWDAVHGSVREVLGESAAETPAKARGDIGHHIVANNQKALEAAKKRAEALGLETVIVTDRLEGEVEEVAERIVASILAQPVSARPVCLLFGGEPTVEVQGTGKGGRNQELALRLLQKIRHHPEIIFLSGATDGIDGNSDAAGGVVTHEDYDLSLPSFLKRSDAYHYLQPRDALIMTGPTGTNVMDLMIAIKGV